jgi:hypothetical protein
MRNLKFLAALAFLAALVTACGGSASTSLPTANSATVEPSVTPGGDADGTAEATADATAEETPPPIAGSSEGTPEVAADPAFMVAVSGDMELSITSENNDIIEVSVVGNPSGEAPVMTTPNLTMRTLRFAPSDESYIFELSFSENNITERTYEIGVDNVGSTVGNNVNEDAAGGAQDSVSPSESTAEATSEALNESGTGNTSGTPDANATPGQDSGTSLDTNNPPSNAPSGGVIETDETLPPVIAARLEPDRGQGTSYNLLLGGTFTIDSISETSVSGSFEFQLAPADNPQQIVTVSGTFTDIPLTAEEDVTVTAVP